MFNAVDLHHAPRRVGHPFSQVQSWWPRCGNDDPRRHLAEEDAHALASAFAPPDWDEDLSASDPV